MKKNKSRQFKSGLDIINKQKERKTAHKESMKQKRTQFIQNSRNILTFNVEFSPDNIFQNFFTKDLFKEFKVDSIHDGLQKKGDTMLATLKSYPEFQDVKFNENDEDLFLEILETNYSDLFNNITYFTLQDIIGNNTKKTKNTIVPTCDVTWKNETSLLNLYTIYDAGIHPNLSKGNSCSNSFDSASTPDNPRMYIDHTTYTVGDAIIAKSLVPGLPIMSTTNNPDSIYRNITSNYVWQMTLYYCLHSGPSEDIHYRSAIQYLSHMYFQLKKGVKKNKILEYYLNPVHIDAFKQIHAFIWNDISDIQLSDYYSIYNSFKEFTDTISQSNCSQFISQYISLPTARCETPTYSDVFAEIESNIEDVSTKIYIGQILKYLGDTSHIVFRNILRRAIEKSPTCPDENSTTSNNAFIICSYDRPLIYRSIMRLEENEGQIFPATRFFKNTVNFQNWYNTLPNPKPKDKECFGKIIKKVLTYQDVINMFEKLNMNTNLRSEQKLIINESTTILKFTSDSTFEFNNELKQKLTNTVSTVDKEYLKNVLKQINEMIKENNDKKELSDNLSFMVNFDFNKEANELMKKIFTGRKNRNLNNEDINPSLVSLNGLKDIPDLFYKILETFQKYYSLLILLRKYDTEKFNEIQINVVEIEKHIISLKSGLVLRFSKYYANNLYPPKIDSKESNRTNYIKEVIEIFNNITVVLSTRMITQVGNAPCAIGYAISKKHFVFESEKRKVFYELFFKLKPPTFDNNYHNRIERVFQQIQSDQTKYEYSQNNHLDEHLKMYNNYSSQLTLDNNIVNLTEEFVANVYYYSSKIDEFFDMHDNDNEYVNNPPIYMLNYLLKSHMKSKYDIYKLILEKIGSTKNEYINKVITEIFRQHLHRYEENNCSTFYDEFALNMNAYLHEIENAVTILFQHNSELCVKFINAYIEVVEKSSFDVRNIHWDIFKINGMVAITANKIDPTIYEKYITLNNFNHKFYYIPDNNYDGYTPYNLYDLKLKIQTAIEYSRDKQQCSIQDIFNLKQFIALFKQCVYILQLTFFQDDNENYFAPMIASFDYLEQYNKEDNTTYFYEYNQIINEFVEHLENNGFRREFENIVDDISTRLFTKCSLNPDICVELESVTQSVWYTDKKKIKTIVKQLFNNIFDNLQTYNNVYKQCEYLFEENQNVSIGQNFQEWVREIDNVLSYLVHDGKNIQFSGGQVKAGVKKRGKTTKYKKKKAKTIKHKKLKNASTKYTKNKKKRLSIKKSKSKFNKK